MTEYTEIPLCGGKCVPFYKIKEGTTYELVVLPYRVIPKEALRMWTRMHSAAALLVIKTLTTLMLIFGAEQNNCAS